MTAEEFVKAFYQEKQHLLEEYFSANSETEVKALINRLNLTEEQEKGLKLVFDSAFRDVFYTFLLGLEGSTSIGGIQEMYDLKDEQGNQLSGEIEDYAFEYFQE